MSESDSSFPDLFRSRAVEAAQGLLGSALGAAPLSWTIVTGFLSLSLIALIAFAALAGVSRSEHAPGWLEPVGGSARMLPPRFGILSNLAVHEGDLVTVGQPLFAIRTAEAIGDGLTTVEGEMQASLQREAWSLDEQQKAERTGAAAEQEQLATKIRALGAQLDNLQTQRGIQEERVAVAGERARKARDLQEVGLITDTEYRARQDSWLGQRQDLAALDSQITERKAERIEAIGQVERARADGASRQARLAATSAGLRGRRSEIAVRGGQVVIAPLAGRVTALQAEAGQPVEPTHPVLTIIPVGAALEAELLVPSRAIGFVHPGQRVRLAYEAFPLERFGVYWGTITSVSEVVLRPDDLAGPVHPAEPSYRARVRLDRGDVDAAGRVVPLQPDMEVSADILLERRSILAWMMRPLLDIWRRT
jgi:membrane fusion protein